MGRSRSHCQMALRPASELSALRFFAGLHLRWVPGSAGPWQIWEQSGQVSLLTRNSARGISPAAGSLPHEIVDRAFRNLKLQFSCEDVRDIPIRQPALAQLVYQFAVRFQTGAPRLLGRPCSECPEICLPRSRKTASTCTGQKPDKFRTNTGQRPDRSPQRAPPEPKPPGLGMVSF